MAKASTPKLALSANELQDYMDEVFPERHALWPPTHIEHLAPLEARLRMEFDHRILRPGGTVSGPAMFKLADYGLYVAILGVIGKAPLAVTTSLHIDFLRRPLKSDLLAEVKLLKLGSRLAMGEVSLYSDGSPEMVAHASGTYSLPPKDAS
ncbi:MAG: PaaI family thioesterase [Pseudomonadota bacterium]|nr:PaaI family thioesterase [Pseudomonadota bacterium]